MEDRDMRQAADYWFGQSHRHWHLKARDENGNVYHVRTLWREGEDVRIAEHRLVSMMKKKHGLITAY